LLGDIDLLLVLERLHALEEPQPRADRTDQEHGDEREHAEASAPSISCHSYILADRAQETGAA
jgi:hypothetical protein